jgi:hypothetical protein
MKNFMIEINPSDLMISICGASTNDRYKSGIYNVKIVHVPTQASSECMLDCDRHPGEILIDSRMCAFEKLKSMLWIISKSKVTNP